MDQNWDNSSVPLSQFGMEGFMEIIASKDNEVIKNIRKLKEKKYRDLENCYIIEGLKLVKEAIEEKAKIKRVVICEECINEEIDKDTMYEIAKHNLIYVTKKVFDLITDVKTPQGILAVVEKNSSNVIGNSVSNSANDKLNDNTKSGVSINNIDFSQDIIIALDGVQDPGNLGTILRTVDSANLNQIILSKNTADPYNPKVVRSTMGAIFRLNIIQTEDLTKTLKEIKKKKFKIMITSLQAKENIYEANYDQKVIVIGNEANGVSQEIQDIADEKVIIPMLGKTESLNASVATGIMIYEYVRRKIS